jgi:hypothetical protein
MTLHWGSMGQPQVCLIGQYKYSRNIQEMFKKYSKNIQELCNLSEYGGGGVGNALEMGPGNWHKAETNIN